MLLERLWLRRVRIGLVLSAQHGSDILDDLGKALRLRLGVGHPNTFRSSCPSPAASESRRPGSGPRPSESDRPGPHWQFQVEGVSRA